MYAIRSYYDYQEKISYSREKANKVVLAETEHSRSTLWCLLPVDAAAADEPLQWALTDADGGFELFGLREGEYRNNFV